MQNADFPAPLVEQLAFVEQQFAANDFVASGGIAAEVDATHVILFLLIELQRKVDDLSVVMDIEIRLGSEIDETVLAVDAGVFLHGLAELCDVKYFALLYRKGSLERFLF